MRISDWSSDVCSSDLRSKAEHYRREPMAKAWALASRPQGMPAEANFELIDLPQRALADGEVRIANRWLSVDPYMRGRMNDVKSYVPPYAQIGSASCRERVCQSVSVSVVTVSLTKKNRQISLKQ